jgi:hypothetical protein
VFTVGGGRMHMKVNLGFHRFLSLCFLDFNKPGQSRQQIQPGANETAVFQMSTSR